MLFEGEVRATGFMWAVEAAASRENARRSRGIFQMCGTATHLTCALLRSSQVRLAAAPLPPYKFKKADLPAANLKICCFLYFTEASSRSCCSTRNRFLPPYRNRGRTYCLCHHLLLYKSENYRSAHSTGQAPRHRR